MIAPEAHLDLAVVGGTVVGSGRMRTADVLVSQGRIVGVVDPAVTRQLAVAKVIDAQGCYVMPGGVDAHVHFNFELPPLRSQSYGQGSLAALWGGTTTVLDFAFRPPSGGSPLLAAEEKLSEALGEMSCDFGLHVILAGVLEESDLNEVDELVRKGFSSVKIFMNFTDFYPGDGPTSQLFERLAAAGGTAVVHAENCSVIESRSRRLIEKGLGDYRHAEDSRPDWAEAEAVCRAIALARAQGTPLFVLHLSSGLAVGEVRRAQQAGARVFAETCHNYLVFTKEDVVSRPDGANWGNYPPLRPLPNREQLWEAIRDGTICHVSTDDYASTLSNRNSVGMQLPTIPAGHNGVETRLAVVYTEAVARRGLAVTDFVSLTSTEISKRLGLYPRKGSLEVGADADLVVFDPRAKGRYTLAELHTVDYSIWDGYEYEGKPVVTVLRGQVMVDHGKYIGPRGGGEFLARPVSCLAA